MQAATASAANRSTQEAMPLQFHRSFSFEAIVSISRRLLIAFIVCLVAAISIGAIGVVGISRVNDSLRYVNENTLPSIKAISNAKDGVAGLRRAVLQFILAPDAGSRESLEKRVNS